MKIDASKYLFTFLNVGLLAVFSVSAGCRHVDTKKESTDKYVASRRGLTPAEKKNLQAEIDKLQASSLSKKDKEKAQIEVYHRYFQLSVLPKKGQ